MRLSHFFIDRPIFAAVLAIFITLIGGVAYFTLPVAQYPEIAPPTIVVTASYPGASAEVVSNTVATPLEQEINGVEHMLYMVSQATADGNLQLTVTFALGTNLDIAQVLVQNRVAVAEPRLPEEVRRIGVTVRKNSPDLMMVIHLSSPDASRDQLYISNYATLQIKDVLARLDGVGDVRVFGARDYAMRIWLDPERTAARNLTAGEVVAALQAQNVQVAAGVLNQPPVPKPGAFQLNIETLGRLTDPRQFANIIVRTDSDGRVTRIRDIGTRRARRPGLQRQRLSRRALGGAAADLPAPRLQRPRHRRRNPDDDEGAGEGFPHRPAVRRRLQPDRLHRPVRRGREAHHLRGRRPGRARGDPLPADLARLDHPDRRHPGLADRHLRRAGRGSASRSTTSRCSGSCWRSASWSTTPSSWSRTSSAICARACRRRRRRTAPWMRSAPPSSPSPSCCRRCSCRPPSYPASPASSSASSPSPSPPLPSSPASCRSP